MKNTLFIIIITSMFSCNDVGILGGSQNVDNSNPYHDQVVGNSSRDMVRDNPFKALKVEILYSSAQPNDQSLINARAFLETYLNKSKGIVVTKRFADMNESGSLTISQVQALEGPFRTAYNKGDTLAINILFLNASFSQANVLGVAYKNTSLALFARTINDNSGGIGQPSKTLLETTVLNHELGHLLGLVNTGTPMQNAHQDSPNGAHCNNEDCLMYYQVETADIISNLIGLSSAPELDSNCERDLRGIGGK
jgi:hypothetical protein